MELFVVKNDAGEVVENGSFKNKMDAKALRNTLNIAAGQTKEEMLVTPKYRVSKGKDHNN